MHKPARKQGRYAEDIVTTGWSISPSLTVGLVHVLPAHETCEIRPSKDKIVK